MANTPERFHENLEQSRSRRGFLTWVSQVAAGVSIAGMGLGLLKPLEALAAPDCNPCTGCRILCQYFNSQCCTDTNYPIISEVQNITGCVPPGCVYGKSYYACASTYGVCPVKGTSCSGCS